MPQNHKERGYLFDIPFMVVVVNMLSHISCESICLTSPSLLSLYLFNHVPMLCPVKSL